MAASRGFRGEQMNRRVGIWKVAAGAGLLALALAGCGSSSGTAAAPPTTKAASTTSTAAPTQAVVSANEVRVIPGSATGKSPCEQAAPTPASPGEVGAGAGGSAAIKSAAEVAAAEHGVRGKVQPVTLTKSEQSALDAQMAAAASVARAYPTVKDAVAAGYRMSTVYVPCIGAHYTNISLVENFDPAHPSELLYDGTSPNSKIVGLSYLVYHTNGPPPGFAGPNDRWHQHNANGGLCLRGAVVIAGEESTRQQCAAMGGHKTLLTDIWMVHAWIVPGISCDWGTFSGECPQLGGRIGGTAFDGPHPSKFS
jgi:hypothetical protein